MRVKDFIFYYEETDEPNGLEVIVPVKKHQKSEFFRAIEEQLMYVPNIIFKVKDQGSFDYKVIDIAAKIIYQDENIIISESTVFDRPHILLGANGSYINYGMVDFEQLELEPRRGAVGLILDINDVEVTPSRESVVWNAKTRAAVIDAYNKIVETATKLVNKELAAAKDYLEWLKMAAGIKNALVAGNSDKSSAIQQLAGVLDVNSINKIYYTRDGINKLFVSDPNTMFGKHVLVRKYWYDRWGRKVKREKLKSVNTLTGHSIYILDGPSDKYVDRYIYEEIEEKEFIVIKKLEGWENKRESELLCKSRIAKNYKSVVVPEEVMDRYILEEENDGYILDDEGNTQPTMDPNRLAKLRKLNQKILYHRASKDGGDIVFSSNEVSIAEIIKLFKDSTVIYGTFNNRKAIKDIISMFPYKMFITNEYQINYSVRHSEASVDYIKLLDKHNIGIYDSILIAKENIKYFKNRSQYIHISEYIIKSYRDGRIEFHDDIQFVVTMHVVSNMIASYDSDSYFPELNTYTYDSPEADEFFGTEFKKLINLARYIGSAARQSLPVYIKAAVNYQLAKLDDADELTLQGYIEEFEESMPDEICDIIDEISDIQIIDVELIKKVREYISYYKRFIPILEKLNYESDLVILQILNSLLQEINSEKPKPLGWVE